MPAHSTAWATAHLRHAPDSLHPSPVRSAVLGSQGANTAVAVSRLRSSSPSSFSATSSHVRFVGQLGSDSHQSMLRETLAAANIDASLCRVMEGSATGAAFILRLPKGLNSIVLLGGANQQWPQPPLSAEAVAAIRRADLVLLQREVPDDVNDAVAAALQGEREAVDAGEDDGARRRLLVDVGGSSSPLSPALLARTLILAPNETELAGLTGCSTDSVPSLLHTAAQAQRSLNVPYLLVTMGEGGSFLFLPTPPPPPTQSTTCTPHSPAQPQPSTAASSPSHPSHLHCPAFAVDVVDSTGAGDTYRGAFAVAFTSLAPSARASPASLYSCMRFAAAAAALSCTQPGTIPSIPTRQQVDAFIAQHDAQHPHHNPFEHIHH